MKTLIKLLPVLAAFAIATICDAQPDSWTTVADFDGGARSGAVSFTIGDTAYAGTGFNGTHLNDFWKRDPATGTWLPMQALSGIGREGAVAFTINGKGYVGTGRYSDPSLALADFHEYDPSTGQWTPIADCPLGGGVKYATAFSIDGKGYVTTGIASGTVDKLTDLVEYDPGTGLWTSAKPPLTGPARAYACSFVLGNKAYVYGGASDNSGMLNDLWSYDNTYGWQPHTAMPTVGRGLAMAFHIANGGFIAGGLADGNTPLGELWEYNPMIDGWYNRTGMVLGGRLYGTAFTMGSSAFVGMGLDASGSSPLASIEEYTPFDLDCQNVPGGGAFPGTGCEDGQSTTVNDTWSNSCLCAGHIPNNEWIRREDFTLGNPRTGAVSFTINDVAYFGGGADANGAVNDFYRYDPVNGWTAIDSIPDGPRIYAVAFSSGGKGYVGAGSDNLFYEYDPTNGDGGSWTQVAEPLPGPVRAYATSFTINDEGYVGLGQTAGPVFFRDFYKFIPGPEPGSGTWEPIQDPFPAHQAWLNGEFYDTGIAFATGFSVGGTGYVCGGAYDNSNGESFTPLNELWAYTPGSGWVQKLSLPIGNRILATGFSIGDKGYVGTGLSYPFALNDDFYEYDPSNDSWTQRATYSGGPRQFATGFSLNGKGYIVGGSNNTANYPNDLWEYTPPVTCVAGTPCDLDPCIIGETLDANCVCSGGTPDLADDDLDGVLDCQEDPTCLITLDPENGVNALGCSCAQLATFEDGDPCTLDQCTSGEVTHTFQDTDGDGVCDASDICPGFSDSMDTDGDLIPDGCDPCTPGVGYTVAPTTFSPIADAGATVTLGDDQMSGSLPIGFPFNFYGTSYTNFHICSNGWMTFSAGQTASYQAQLLPTAASATVPTNLIAAAWVDLNPPQGGSISYATTGTSPNQVLSVTWTAVPLYQNVTPGVTVQIQLHEGSDAIEIHSTSIPTYASAKTQGVQNSGGTVGTASPGRNQTAWTATNDAYRFTPVATGPGAACSTGNECTTGVLDATCNCVSTPVADGTTCSTGICQSGACTPMGGDADSDGVPDASDSCPYVAGQIGSSCDDGSASTINDVLNASCICAGTPICIPPGTVLVSGSVPVCTGTIFLNGGTLQGTGPFTYSWTGPGTIANPEQPSTACDGVDGTNSYSLTVANACGSSVGSISITLTPLISQASVLDESCPGASDGSITIETLNNVTGIQYWWRTPTECTTGVECTGNFFWCQGGQCSNLFAQQSVGGLAPGTYIVTASSSGFGCSSTRTYTVGTNTLDTDADGVVDCLDNCPTVAGQIGSSCNDNNPCTINDVLNASCVCTGTFQDTDGDGVCDASDNCPNVVGQIGSSCDDGSASTINDILRANCTCFGTLSLPEISVQQPDGNALSGVIAWGDNGIGQSTVPPSAQSDIIAVSAGFEFSLALKTNGSVIAWGNNNYGQTVVPVSAQSGVTAIAAGQRHSIALKSDGSVVAWGDNFFGQLSMPLAAQSGVTAIATRGLHSLALKNDGSVIAWGYNLDGQSNVPLAAQSGIVGIAAGQYFSMALKNDGSVIAWGENDHGQTTIPIEAQSGVIAIAATADACFALKSDGSVIDWGDWYPVPLEAQSGVTAIAPGLALKTDGSVIQWPGAAPAAAQSGIASISGEFGFHALALKNALLPIGFGDQTIATTSAAKTFTIRNTGNASLIGIALNKTGANPSDFTLDTGGMFSSLPPGGSTTFTVTFTPGATGARGCILNVVSNDNNENPYSIGLTGNGVPLDTDGDGVPDATDNCPNVYGQIGSSCDDGYASTINDILRANCTCFGTLSLPEISVEQPDGNALSGVIAWGDNTIGQSTVPLAAQSGVTAITAGFAFSEALKSDGSVVGWGNNDLGQTDIPSSAQSGVVAISAGNNHSLALKSDGSVVAWGVNNVGQTDVPSAAQSGVVAIAAGGTHSLALKSDGSVIAWGSNGYGQTEIPASAQSGVTAISASSDHSLVLKNDGSVTAWGTNFSGESTVPIAAQSGVTAIACGSDFSLALRIDGSVIAWGSNGYGQTNVPVSAQSGITAIAAKGNFALALKSDGSVIAWGSNFNGSTDVPVSAQSGVTAIAGGFYFALALKNALLPVDFGDQTVSTTSTAKTFTIRNTGNASLTGLAITKTGANPGDFTVNTSGMLTTVPPGGSTTFSVTFTPASTGARGATLHIASNDNNENPYSIELTGNGVPMDTDGDGVPNAGDNCPTVVGQIGSSCDDGYANTINDALNSSCVCAGTPVVVCTIDLQLVFQTDGVSTTGWELHQQGTGTIVQSGGGQYPGSPNYVVTTCLPNGNYYLVVTDNSCNGITNGGYILRTVGGATLIDNRNNFLSGCTSQIAGGEGFTLPVGTDRLLSTSCDKLDWRSSEYVVASDNAAVTNVWNNFPAGSTQRATSGYEMWWYNPNGGYTFRRFQSHATNNGMTANAIRACHFKINSWSGNQLVQGTLYNVKVRSRVIGTNASWGPACRFVLDPVRAQCPLTHLMDVPGNQYLSCGATRAIGSGSANLVHARVATRVINNVSTDANKYQFRFRIVNEGVSITKTSATGQYWVNTQGLAPCKQYEVDVRASFDNGATYCDAFAASNPYAPSWGRLCTLNTSGCPSGNGGGQNMLADGSASTGSARQLVLYPNPNNGEQLFLSMDQVKEGVNKVNIDIHDSFGKRVSASTIAVADGHLNTVLDLKGELAAGMYVVNITAGDDTYTERLVIQP